MATIAFRVADLPAEFCRLPHADQLVLIRTATGLYTEVKEGLYASWSAAMTADETTKAEQWREEGRKAASAEAMMTLQSVTAEKRLMAEALVQAEAINVSLRDAIEKEAGRRLVEKMEAVRTEFEMEKMREMVALRERLATLESREKYTVSLEETVGYLKEKVATVEAKFMEQTIATTRSSHAIGKAGETEIYDLLENVVCPAFQFSTLKNMSHIYHAAAFHLSVMAEDGSKIKILIDAKKYNYPVTSAEIQKLHKDVDADDDARAGLMVSIQTHIQTAKTFQIRKTERNRPVMCISFQHVDESMRGEILCWAVRVLQAIAVEKNGDDRQIMIEKLDIFLKSLQQEVMGMDVNIRQVLKTVEAFKKVRNTLLEKITKFSTIGTVDEADMDDKIEHIVEDTEIEEKPATRDMIRCEFIKKDGKRCQIKRVDGAEFCKIHGGGK